MDWGCHLVVEHLPAMLVALGSVRSTVKHTESILYLYSWKKHKCPVGTCDACVVFIESESLENIARLKALGARVRQSPLAGRHEPALGLVLSGHQHLGLPF